MDEPASGERIIAHLGFARAVAARSLDPRCRGADREDLIAWGVVGLVHAGGKLAPLSARGLYALRHIPDVVLRRVTLGRDLAARDAGDQVRWYLPSADFDQVTDRDNCPVTLEHAKSVAVTSKGILASPHNEDGVVAEPA